MPNICHNASAAFNDKTPAEIREIMQTLSPNDLFEALQTLAGKSDTHHARDGVLGNPEYMLFAATRDPDCLMFSLLSQKDWAEIRHIYEAQTGKPIREPKLEKHPELLREKDPLTAELVLAALSHKDKYTPSDGATIEEYAGDLEADEWQKIHSAYIHSPEYSISHSQSVSKMNENGAGTGHTPGGGS